MATARRRCTVRYLFDDNDDTRVIYCYLQLFIVTDDKKGWYFCEFEGKNLKKGEMVMKFSQKKSWYFDDVFYGRDNQAVYCSNYVFVEVITNRVNRTIVNVVRSGAICERSLRR